MWTPPSLTLKWGPYTKPDPTEQLATVQTVQTALGGSNGTPIVTLALAVEKLRQGGVFDIDNVAAVLDELNAAAEEKAKRDEESAKRDLEHSLAQIEAKTGAAPKPAQAQPQRGGKPPRGKP